jgi:O-antigen/teichoic acid export membrane protein
MRLFSRLPPSVWSLTRSSGVLLLSNVLVLLLGLIRTPLITWMIPKEQVGMIGIVSSWLPIVLLISMSGIDSAAYHYLTKGHPRAFITGVIYRFRWSLLGGLVFIIGAIYWFSQAEIILGWMFIIAGITFPFTYAMTAAPGYFGAKGSFKSLFWYRIGESVTDFFGFIPILLSLIWLTKGITFYLSNQIASLVLQVGATLWIIRNILGGSPPEFSEETRKGMVQFGRHQNALIGISVLQSRLDAWLVGMSQPLTTMADYSIALIVQEQLRKLWGIYSTLRYPVLVKMSYVSRKMRIIKEGIVVFFGMTVAGVLIVLLSYWLIPLLLPESYLRSIQYIPVLIAAVLVGIPGGITEMFFKMNEDARSQYSMRVFGAIFGILAPLIFLSKFGALGAAYGRMIANLLFSVIGIILFIKSKKPELN